MIPFASLISMKRCFFCASAIQFDVLYQFKSSIGKRIRFIVTYYLEKLYHNKGYAKIGTNL